MTFFLFAPCKVQVNGLDCSRLAHGGPFCERTENQMSTSQKRGRPAGKSRSECQCVGYLRRTALLPQLNSLVSSGRIGHFWAIEHDADEDTSKPHWHLRMIPPPSRSVDWKALCEAVSEVVPGELLPRRLVLGKGAVNDASFDGLLYARHDSRYCEAKGLVKATLDYPKDRFYTDDPDWFDGLWLAADQFEPERRKMSKLDVVEMLEKCKGRLSNRQLLRVVLLNGMTLGDYQLFGRYCAELRHDDEREKKAVTAGEDPSQPDLPF